MLELFSNCHNLVKLSGEIISCNMIYYLVSKLVIKYFCFLGVKIRYYQAPIPQLFGSLIQRVLTWKITEPQNISFSNFNCLHIEGERSDQASHI